MMQVDSNILVEKSHLRFITISVVKKKKTKQNRKIKRKPKLKTINNRH